MQLVQFPSRKTLLHKYVVLCRCTDTALIILLPVAASEAAAGVAWQTAAVTSNAAAVASVQKARVSLLAQHHALLSWAEGLLLPQHALARLPCLQQQHLPADGQQLPGNHSPLPPACVHAHMHIQIVRVA